MHDHRSDAHHADLVVVGSGVAGLSAALAAADGGATVLLLTAGALLSGSSPWAQGGIAAALGADDAPDLHAADTLRVGAGLNDTQSVRVLVTAGRAAVQDLLRSGVPFDGGAQHPDLGLEAGHGRRRILHANGAATGAAVTGALLARVVSNPRIGVWAHTPAHALLTRGARVVGVQSNGASYYGQAVVLATGGFAALWQRTTNAPESRGQGLALAWQAGATLADLEFVQFHPTALSLPGKPAFLLSEALRGEGALLVDGAGQPVVDPLLPRDQLARAIVRYRDRHGPVFLSLRHLDPTTVHGHFATLSQQLEAWQLDLARDLLPVAPAAHYCMGGVRSDDSGRTDLPGLYVAGEVACTGAQGANRLASNSLLECLVFGRRAAETALTDPAYACAHWPSHPLPSLAPRTTEALQAVVSIDGPQSLGDDLDRDLGVERQATHLTTLYDRLSRHPHSAELLIARLSTQSALLRQESRGAHYRLDLPSPVPAWQGHILWRREEEPRFERIHP